MNEDVARRVAPGAGDDLLLHARVRVREDGPFGLAAVPLV